MASIRAAKISMQTIYRLIGTGTFCSFFPLSILSGMAAFFGFGTVTANHQPVTGVAALYESPLTSLFAAVLFAAFFGSMVALGLWPYSKFWPVAIEYEPLEPQT